MTSIQWFYLALSGLFSIYFLQLAVKRYRYRTAIARAFPDAWVDILQRRLPIYNKLTNSLQENLQAKIQKFLYTKQFVGCDGFEISDEVRVIIAAEACLLVLNRPSTAYKKLRWIYIYPSTFIAKREQQDAYGIVSPANSHLLGVSWSNGKVVLAWDSVERGVNNFRDGQNVVLHEFAHQLDQEDGSADGAPLLYTRDAYSVWSRVFSHEFENLHKNLERRKPSLIDSYGATNPAEFFAVVTELFFEKPGSMRKEHPELFEVLRHYYKLDPAQWQ